MKTLALIARRPDTSLTAFREHYEQVHAPLALPVMSGLLRYVRHHVREELHGTAGFDVVSSFAWRDAAAAQGVLARLATPAGEAILRDELTFMDKPRNRFFAVREAGETGARDPAAALKCIALVKGPLDAEALRALQGAVRGLAWSLHHQALTGFGPPLFDSVTQLHAAADVGLARWAASLERVGAVVVIVSVSEHETPLPLAGLP